MERKSRNRTKFPRNFRISKKFFRSKNFEIRQIRNKDIALVPQNFRDFDNFEQFDESTKFFRPKNIISNEIIKKINIEKILRNY